MAFNIGPTIAVNGENEYKQALTRIRSEMKLVKAETAAMASEFDAQGKSQKSAQANLEGLRQAQELQKQAVEETRKALEDLRSKGFEENSAEMIKMKTNLKNAETELNKTTKEIDEQKKAVSPLTKVYEDFKTGVGKAMDGVKAFAKGLGAATVAAGAAAVKMVAEVVKSTAELEQNLGGAKSVFGDYYGGIKTEAENAYKSMGLSESDYLASANKMAALFQGSGLSQAESFNATRDAMQRAADMASVMGISSEEAMQAVEGMAKGNLTMMDNLGVSMNATTLDAYAMGKGFDKAYKDMTNTEKVNLAMDYFMEQTSQYAGNFEKEATETISGSLSMLSTSFENLKAGIGTAGADSKQLIADVVDSFMTVVENISPVVENIVAALPGALNQIVSALMGQAPTLINTIAQIAAQLLVTLAEATPELIPVIFDAIGTVITALWDNLPRILQAAGKVGLNLIQGIWNGIKDAASWLWDKLKGWCSDIVGKIKGFFGIHSPSTVFAGFGKNMALGLGNGFTDEMKSVNRDMMNSLAGTAALAPALTIAGSYGRGTTVNQYNTFSGYAARDGMTVLRQLNRQLGFAI